jgi:cation diffusion facilitator CzcD-associated flavoprotein CzcO
MSPSKHSINAIIIGAGPSGIAMAHSLKYKLEFDDFTVGTPPITNNRRYRG